MTLSSAVSKVVDTDAGGKTSFSTVFPFLANADLTVKLTNAAGFETTWVEGIHYTLDGAGTGGAGTLTVITSPTDYTPGVGTALTIVRAPSATQDTDLPLGGNLSATVLEQTFDRNIMVVQRAVEELDRAPKVPAMESGAADLPASAARTNKYLAFDSNGDTIAVTGPTGPGSPSINGFIETLLDDKDPDTAQTTLGGGAIGKGVFTATDAIVAIDTMGGLKQGKRTIWIPASAMRPTVTYGCAQLTDVQTIAGRPDLQVLDFDPGETAEEAAQFQVAFPDSWDLGTVTFQVFWTTAAAGTSVVAWGLQGITVADGTSADVTFGTAVLVTDDAEGAANDVLVTAESPALTIAGTPAKGDLCFFRIFRDTDHANDDMTEDARLIGVKLFFTVDAKDDA